MRKRSRPVLALAVCVPTLAAALTTVLAAPASAEGGAKARKDAGSDEHRDPNNVTGLARWMELCVEGNAKYLARDHAGAVESYRAAVKLAPKQPVPHYLLGEAHVGTGNLEEASRAFEQAEQASDKRDSLLRAKILFVIADLRERQRRWEDAKAGWQAYNEWVFAQADGGTFPLSAGARVKAMDDEIKLDRATQVVRDRIAAAAEAGAFPSPAESKPGADAGGGAKSPKR